jgi:hypothetical protein
MSYSAALATSSLPRLSVYPTYRRDTLCKKVLDKIAVPSSSHFSLFKWTEPTDMRGHDRQNPVSNADVANLNSVVPNCCFIRTEFKRAQQNLRLQDRI